MTVLTKPVCRSTDCPTMPHGFRNRLIITLHPGAWVEIRESRRREVVRLDLGTLYAKALVRKVMDEVRAARRKRGGK